MSLDSSVSPECQGGWYTGTSRRGPGRRRRARGAAARRRARRGGRARGRWAWPRGPTRRARSAPAGAACSPPGSPGVPASRH